LPGFAQPGGMLDDHVGLALCLVNSSIAQLGNKPCAH
jgi:hypothetical protein